MTRTTRQWTREEILDLVRGYQPACILAAAAELDVFRALAGRGRSARQAARALECDERGITILLDALVALEILTKEGDDYAAPESVAAALGGEGPGSVLAMARHQANCLRRWSDLARVVTSGRPAERRASIRGEEGDTESFINAMNDVSGPVAAQVVASLGPPAFRRLLDVGGGPGTWTAAFLEASPGSTAVLFDLPDVIPLAAARLSARGLGDRVTFAAGDFLAARLPDGVDFAWVSAIVHQNSRDQNRALLASVCCALEPAGRVAIRDILMDPSRTTPAAGALFAVNMLVATEGGGTWTFDELREDLESVGFESVTCARRDEGMNAVVMATKPAAASGRTGPPARP